LRGLDESVRSFIMQMCERVDDAPDENCDHDELFNGEFPQESVDLEAFEIDAGEVTVGAYRKCVDAGECSAIDYKNCAVWTHLGLQVALRVPRSLQRPAAPVTCVNLAQAKDYCEFAGGALPTHDQWEKAARGDDARLFPWGNAWSSDVANWAEMDLIQNPVVGRLDGFARVAPPGSFPDGKSPFGAYDMAGNVAEWVVSANDSTNDDSAGDSKAGARGGSWTSHPFDLRVTQRMEIDPDATRTDVGFRCAYR
jgi:formylglycine-generating enzyme required for sulfatase activity